MHSIGKEKEAVRYITYIYIYICGRAHRQARRVGKQQVKVKA